MTEPISAPALQQILNSSMTERGPGRTIKFTTPFGSMFMAVEVIDGKPAFVISSPQKLEDTTVRELLDNVADAATKLVRQK